MDMVFSLDFVSVPKCFGKIFLVRNKLIFIKKNMRGECDCETHNPTLLIFTIFLPFTCDIEAV